MNADSTSESSDPEVSPNTLLRDGLSSLSPVAIVLKLKDAKSVSIAPCPRRACMKSAIPPSSSCLSQFDVTRSRMQPSVATEGFDVDSTGELVWTCGGVWGRGGEEGAASRGASNMLARDAFGCACTSCKLNKPSSPSSSFSCPSPRSLRHPIVLVEGFNPREGSSGSMRCPIDRAKSCECCVS